MYRGCWSGLLSWGGGVEEGVVLMVISGGYISKCPLQDRVLESDMASVESK